MHEMSLVRKVVDVVLSECEGKNIARVRTVHLSIGELSDVVEEYVQSLFQFLARDTIAENAEVAITRIPVNVRCNQCCNIFPIEIRNEDTWECPRCHAVHDYRLFSGREFRVDNIDVEAAVSSAEAVLPLE
ncbi:MAG: hydrogenase maturation nickel metallochaperone HypA [Gordonibacter sp.]|uniref:hydrogenase maturation nickel metallochaperone HypA n=1 Tax=Gordonibacter sp. TaxID=1968902 RepID=UPI002FC99872